jgi:hypothetical protein
MSGPATDAAAIRAAGTHGSTTLTAGHPGGGTHGSACLRPATREAAIRAPVSGELAFRLEPAHR